MPAPQMTEQKTKTKIVSVALLTSAAFVIAVGAYSFLSLSKPSPTSNNTTKTTTNTNASVVYPGGPLVDLLLARLVPSTPTIQPGDTVTLTLNLNQLPQNGPIVQGVLGHMPIQTGVIDFANSSIVTQGTIMQGSMTVFGNCAACPMEGRDLMVFGAIRLDPVTTTGTMVKFQLKTLPTAPAGTYTIPVLPSLGSGELFFNVLPRNTVIGSATFTIATPTRSGEEVAPARGSLLPGEQPSTTLMAATLVPSKTRVVPGEEFTIDMNITAPPYGVGFFRGNFLGLTSPLVDTNISTSTTTLETTGTLTQNGWIWVRNFCPGGTCGTLPEGAGMIVAMAGTESVSTAGTFVKVKVKVKADAPLGTYTIGLAGVEGEMFGTVNETITPEQVKVTPATITVTGGPKPPPQEVAP